MATNTATAFIDFTAPLRGAEMARRENNNMNSYQANIPIYREAAARANQGLDRLTGLKESTSYLSTFTSNLQAARKMGLSAAQYLTAQMQAVNSDPAFLRMSPEGKSQVMSQLNSYGSNLAKELMFNGKFDEASELAKLGFGVDPTEATKALYRVNQGALIANGANSLNDIIQRGLTPQPSINDIIMNAFNPDRGGTLTLGDPIMVQDQDDAAPDAPVAPVAGAVPNPQAAFSDALDRLPNDNQFQNSSTPNQFNYGGSNDVSNNALGGNMPGSGAAGYPNNIIFNPGSFPSLPTYGLPASSNYLSDKFKR